MKKKVVKQGIICGCLILMIGILVAGKGANKDDLKEESDLKEYNLPPLICGSIFSLYHPPNINNGYIVEVAVP